MRVASVSQPRRRSLTNVHLLERAARPIEREVAAQRSAMGRDKSKLRDLGDEEIRVPIGAFEELELSLPASPPHPARTSCEGSPSPQPTIFRWRHHHDIASRASRTAPLSLPPNDPEAPAPAFEREPEQIISFVQDTYANIDGQLADYQDDALAKNALANQLRDYKKLVREYPRQEAGRFPHDATRYRR